MILAYLSWLFAGNFLYVLANYPKVFRIRYEHIEWSEEQRKKDDFLTNRNFWLDRYKELPKERVKFMLREIFFTLTFILYVTIGCFSNQYELFLYTALFNVVCFTFLKYFPLKGKRTGRKIVTFLIAFGNLLACANIFIEYIR